LSGESLFVPLSLQLLSAKTDPTLILGVEVGNASRDSSSREFVVLTGDFGRNDQLGIQERSTSFPVPDPLPDGWRTWQTYHIVDLGFFAQIAKKNVLDGINKDDWQKMKDATIGDKDTSPSSL